MHIWSKSIEHIWILLVQQKAGPWGHWLWFHEVMTQERSLSLKWLSASWHQPTGGDHRQALGRRASTWGQAETLRWPWARFQLCGAGRCWADRWAADCSDDHLGHLCINHEKNNYSLSNLRITDSWNERTTPLLWSHASGLSLIIDVWASIDLQLVSRVTFSLHLQMFGSNRWTNQSLWLIND